ncbi:DNA repair ATPase [Streptomyces sp. NPDC050504]|uniref:DNA repair ATPase n=1 Tax=Streptomyces sp. NPDC050504 TaxID=3365618 RepID=UPI0037A8C447
MDTAYDILRTRLTTHAQTLAARAAALNDARSAAFGSTELTLTATEQLRTALPSLPRDLAAVDGGLLFGYAADPAPPGEPDVGHVFQFHRPHGVAAVDGDGDGGHAEGLQGLLGDPDFTTEFHTLHRYFRSARLLRLRRTEDKLLAVFQTGESGSDVRVLRWRTDGDGTAHFLDARGDRDHVLPPAHDVTWTAATRDDHVRGRHPHIAIRGEVYLDTLHGTLTLKTENDTETPDGIYREPVAEPLQALADAEVEHARVGPLILLRVRPYNEEEHRHLVFNTLTKEAVRIDAIGRSCRRLPDDQGIVFPGGYYLATGAHRTFDVDVDTSALAFEREVHAPGGEDVLYVYRGGGRTLLLPYNLLRKAAATPLTCVGYALFDDGTLHLLREGAPGPARVHQTQVWRTPFTADTRAPEQHVDGALGRVGNADLVRGVSDCLALAHSVSELTPNAEVYGRLVAQCVRASDQYHWLTDPELHALAEPLAALRETAEQIVGEFETVQELTRRAADALADAAAHIAQLVRRIRGEAPRSAAEWVARITELRRAHGHLATLREMRYADVERIDALATDVEHDVASAAQRAVAFLAREDAFDGYHADVAALTDEASAAATAAAAQPLADRVEGLAEGLRTVTEVVAGLDIGDATVRTAILERVAEVLAGVNRARAVLAARRRELLDQEGRAGFTAEFALLNQSVTGALAAAGTPEECDEQLARLLLQLETLESRFAEFDDFLAELAAKRDEVYEAFSSRKQTLQDARARHAERLAGSAARVLDALARRAAELPDLDAVNTHFASDPMVAKVRRTAAELRGIGDQVRADELEGRLKSARQEAVRALRDRAELYADGGRTVRFGRHRFAVNTQPLDLTLVPGADGLSYALTGTDYRAPVTDPAFADTRPYWDRLLPSESPGVYRAEHLAARLIAEHGPAALADALADAELPALVRESARAAYDEGYERGVHDHDATAILGALLELHADAGLLRFPPDARAAAQRHWAHGTDAAFRESWARRARSMARARETFGLTPAIAELRAELTGLEPLAADYLFEEVTSGPPGFVTSGAARALVEKFRTADAAAHEAYEADLAALGDDHAGRAQLVTAWLSAYAATADVSPGDLAEAVAVELCRDLPRYESNAPLSRTVTGLLGAHPRVRAGSMALRLDEFLLRTAEFAARDVPGFRAYQRRRAELVAAERVRLRLEDHRPRAMSGFVRSRLIDEVYLPLIGDNLAKQLGAAGDAKRTDTHGMLLLISPPGYGKTTLMEYVAQKLGLVLVKVDGPALGHEVTSLDPERAPDATARAELEKVHFALESGSNTLLYLDDIQHTSPEFLQKFIPLCDATRSLNGHDLRGKRFAVCMAGNPYTESGGRFQVPDMLANRADVWNLGDVVSGYGAVFADSFVENALTSNPVLAPLAGRDRADLELLLRLAEGDPAARAERLAYPYAPAELDAVLAVLRHLLAARRTVLAVNTAYMASAGQSDATRTEPPFRLQGSYRDMNKIAARIVPVMNGEELAAVLDDHYTGEAQTLTTGAEANLLKLAELRGTLTPEGAARWAELRAAYVRTQALGGPESDPLTRAVSALGVLAERVASVEAAIRGGR